MKRKKILYIHQSAGGGGASTSFFLLIKDINDQSEYVPVVIFGRRGPFEEALRKKGIKTYIKTLSVLGVNTHSTKISAAKIISFLFRFLPNFISVYKIIKRGKVGIVHINSSVLTTSGIASYFTGAKVVWHIREIILNTKIGRLQKFLIKYIASDIIVISKEVGRQFDKQKTTLIYNGVDPEEFAPDSEKEIIKKQYGLDREGETIFTHIGQLFPAKGSFVFLEAAKLLIESGYNAKFFVIGGKFDAFKSSIVAKIKNGLRYILGAKTKNWKVELQRFAQDQGIAERVIFTGYRGDIANFISLSDAIVSPHCVPEPFGRTLIEAGALKKPVISTSLPPTTEIVINGKTGLLVEPNNPQALAKSMEYIINNPAQAQKMGESGYENVINNFHITTTHSKIKKVYEEILKESG